MTTKTHTTAEQFEALADRLGACELVRGEITEMSPSGESQSQVMITVGSILRSWCRANDLGRVRGGEAGFITRRDPDTVRGMDVCYVSYDRQPKDVPSSRGFSTIAPNLAVEIDPKPGWSEVTTKVGEYLAAGVDRVWVVDIEARRVHVFRDDAEPQVLSASETLADELVLPGFRCQVSEFFEDC